MHIVFKQGNVEISKIVWTHFNVWTHNKPIGIVESKCRNNIVIVSQCGDPHMF
jgi:hypothetical protein